MHKASRDFRLFWVAGAADQLGSHASSLVTPVLVLAVGGGPVEAGLVGTFGALARFGVGPFAGVYADRFSRRTQLSAAAVVAAAATGVIAIGVATGTMTWPALLGAAIVQGAAAGWYAAASAAALRRVLPAERPERAVASLRARGQGAELVGPGIGGGLYQLAPAAPFLFDTISYLVSAGLVRLVRADLGPDRRPGPDGSSGFRADLVAGVRFVFQQPFLRFVVIWAGGINLALAALYFHVVLVARMNGASAASIGLILMVSGAVGLVGSLLTPRIMSVVSGDRLVAGASWLLVAVVISLALVESTWQFALVLSAVALISPALSVVLTTRAIMIIPDGMQGRIGTVLSTVSEGAAAFAPLLAGFLVAVTAPLLVAALFGAGLAALAWYATRNRHHVTPPPAPPPEPELATVATTDLKG
ncbi:MFS transporter [Phytohabitans sp. LJ34]|uniref:MFS transporter n=1 Tax=Phytohabitans sp. LJ34 TaxID=3452217 RepID=UPI003F8C4D60